ncbi:MAG: carboxypeptidase regulatory-like domain-containing protein [Pyrinomonadaceae bacterium]|nr:carboxypeptidase regulatory-like domain-containing protein [Pyrinomonadaceae bacterium]
MKQIKSGLNRNFRFAIVYCIVSSFVLTFSGFAFAQKSSENLGTIPPSYQIFDIGVVQTGDTASQGFGISTNGIAVGRSIRTGGAQAFSWTSGGGIVGLPNISGRTFCVSNSANDAGVVVGTCANTLFGTSRLPVVWRSGAVSQLPLPAGETLGDANDVNSSGVAVGSVNSGSLQRAVVYTGNTATVITQTTSGGSFFTTAFGINNSGRVIGTGIDPSNAARNVGMVYDIGSNSATEVGALPNANGALAFSISNAGHVVGSSMQNQGSGLPFIWTQSGGMTAIPLPVDTTQGSARAVNSSGWAVGTASSAFAIPFLYNGIATYRLADLIPAGTGWDLSTNTSSSALGISDTNIIVGTGVFNGQTHAYAMIPVANLSLGGRVLTADGAGIRNAVVTISGGNLPAPVSVQTGAFGTYNFSGLQQSGNFTVTVSSKRYSMIQPTQTIILQSSLSNFNFVATAQ